MALLSTDLFAVYRETDLKNYSATLEDIVAKVPAPEAPGLSAVLTVDNISQNVAIVIQDNNKANVCTLGSNSSTPNFFALKSTFAEEVTIGAGAELLLESTGQIIGPNLLLRGNPTTNFALQVYEAGATNATIANGTADVVANIKNDGTAYFFGALDAASIDGGTYA